MAEVLSRLTAVSSRQLIPNTTSDESYDRQLRDLITYLRQCNRIPVICDTTEFLLENLDPCQHSLSYLYILHLHIRLLQSKDDSLLPNDVLPGGIIWSKALHFLTTFDPIQIRYAGQEWRQLVELVAQAAQTASKPLLAAEVIGDAILRLDSSSETFTSTHLLLVRLCLLAKSYSLALPVLDKHICYLPTDSGQAYQRYHKPFLCAEHESSAAYITGASGFSGRATYRDHLQYFLYGAMIYMALKEWDKALHFLSIVISCPVTNTVSKIMVEAYKKWVLVSLLGNGRILSPPAIISSHVMKVYQSLTRPYTSLANAFESGDFQRLKADVEAARTIWHIDNNVGLVSQVISASHKYMVLKLGRTFSALTMADVAQRTSSSPTSIREIEASVASLIMSGELEATLLHLQDSDHSTMLRFSVTNKSRFYREKHVQDRLNQESQSLKIITGNINQSNYGLELSNENMQFLHRNQKWSDGAEKGGVSAVGESGGFDIDEDIMGDLH